MDSRNGMPAAESVYDEVLVSQLVSGYQDQDELGVTSDDQIRSDVVAKIRSGELTEHDGEEILFRLGLYHVSEGSYD